MKKFVKISLITLFICVFTLGLSLSLFVGIKLVKFSALKLNEELLSSPSANVQIYDFENRLLNEDNTSSQSYAELLTLPAYTKNAFISIEDKNFYNHNGLNYKRIAKAALSNLLSKSLKEGASTISQQLIKNTHLSSEKTFDRKLKEIALTKKLEASYSKDQILEKYLNVIYYGNNCYGIENAANYYFSKPASKLTLEESALLAGMIKSPSKYSPILKEDMALKRRNLVLDEMNKDGYITEEELVQSKCQPIKLNLQTENKNTLNSYSEAALSEACQILNMPAKSIAIAGYKIHTYQDKEKQSRLEKALNSENFMTADHAGIVIDVKKHAVSAYIGSSAYKILDAKRQPGSIMKPLLVYAPALNEDLITPITQLVDEPLVLNGYAPKNVDGKYRGYVSATEALSKSINIPAIKVLSYVGIEKAKNYASDLGLTFDEKDDSYALALGGMTYGENLLTLASAYSTFPNLGKFAPAKFVEYITDENGKILYHHKPEEKQVLREDTAYLMTTMLTESAKTGTAKALADLEMPLASKTGTVGRGKDNIDAYNITYSPCEVCGIWVGNLDNSPIYVAGGNQPTRCVKEYFKSAENEVFTMPECITEKEIDLVSLENEHLAKLALPNTPERFKTTALFSRFNEPKEYATTFSTLPETQFKVSEKNGLITVTFNSQSHIDYNFYDGKEFLQKASGFSGEKTLTLHVKNNLKILYGFDEKNTKEQTFNFADLQSTQSQKKEEQRSSTKRKWFV